MPIEKRSKKESKNFSPRHSSSGARALETDWLVFVALRWLVTDITRLYNIATTWGKDGQSRSIA
ncbi:hypothetical protein [Microcoleus asticus]|uniref:Transposase n=1 Tax=Microcoleus asticus IPMA8 TaxID=2563858 RepID=A0ABX2D1S1_9CYAN|nr:hypothetical protein [Microcoleus asticus]NQE36466.1 hypothetical protein [Microcoleus asticus IPMA8]